MVVNRMVSVSDNVIHINRMVSVSDNVTFLSQINRMVSVTDNVTFLGRTGVFQWVMATTLP